MDFLHKDLNEYPSAQYIHTKFHINTINNLHNFIIKAVAMAAGFGLELGLN